MAKKVKLGVIGMSEGNGHPYSWSAIFNGYDRDSMKACPFPVINEYLSQQDFPKDSLGNLGQVTHIWTQERKISENIAEACKIHNIVDSYPEMIGQVDAVLLARDDAENHFEMAAPFLKAGIPIFIDKPIALSEKDAGRMFETQQYHDQIFTCSSIRFAEELRLSEEEKKDLGKINHVEGSVPKKWDTYAVHVIEPIIANLPHRGDLVQVLPFKKNGIKMCLVEWEEVSAFIKVTGRIPSPVKLQYFGEKGFAEKEFVDAFSCFKSSLECFVGIINKEEKNIDRRETMEVVRIIEKGR